MTGVPRFLLDLCCAAFLGTYVPAWALDWCLFRGFSDAEVCAVRHCRRRGPAVLRDSPKWSSQSAKLGVHVWFPARSLEPKMESTELS